MTVTEQYPPELPLPTFDGYALEPGNRARRTNMESGPARQREEFVHVPDVVPLRWRFTGWQFAVFESWHRYRARSGAVWFGVTLLGGLGMIPCEARFLAQGEKPYSAKPARGGPDGVRWVVTAKVEVRDRPMFSEGALAIVTSEDAEALIAEIEDFHTFIHVTLSDASHAW